MQEPFFKDDTITLIITANSEYQLADLPSKSSVIPIPGTP